MPPFTAMQLVLRRCDLNYSAWIFSLRLEDEQNHVFPVCPSSAKDLPIYIIQRKVDYSQLGVKLNAGV
jgi:hypothetical protein